MKPTNEGTERKTDRLEAFSDAVMAIAITLPVVELHAPTPDKGPLAPAYLELIPEYAAYAVSVIVIGLYWVHGHFTGKIVLKTDHVFNLLSVAFLAAVSVTPFPARPLFEHWAGDGESRTAALVYLGVLTLPAALWLVRWRYAVSRDLLDPALTPKDLHRLSLKYAAMASAYGIAFAAAFWNWRVGLFLSACTTCALVAPPMTPEFKRDAEPADELEEADERR